MKPQVDLDSAQSILAEIGEMHREMRQIHREVLAALRGVLEIVRDVRSLKELEGEVEARLALLTAPPRDKVEVSAPHSHCPRCGAGLERHDAPAGELDLCRICGWSEFVGKDGAIDANAGDEAALSRTVADPRSWAA